MHPYRARFHMRLLEVLLEVYVLVRGGDLCCVRARQPTTDLVVSRPQSVMRSLFMKGWGQTRLGTLLLTLTAHWACGLAAERVLMVFLEDSHVPVMVVSSAEEALL